jgi:hypothetical protein
MIWPHFGSGGMTRSTRAFNPPSGTIPGSLDRVLVMTGTDARVFRENRGLNEEVAFQG